jgi:hypothetical protein
MGFVPLAYREGSEKKKRIHIFWQKRIREGDNETPWWYPAKTEAGALVADRLVFPIPPGMHWSDELPIPVPTAKPQAAIEGPLAVSQSARKKPALDGPVKHGPQQYGPPPTPVSAAQAAVEKPKREKKPKAKVDPALVAKARELRDRWLEHVNSGAMLIEGVGKYDVTRALPELPSKMPSSLPLLPAA